MISDEDDEFIAFQIPRKSLNKEFQGKYRVYFRDGTSEDFKAETVTEALAALDDVKKKVVMKIINLETEYKKTLKNNFLQSTEESVPTQIEPDDKAPRNLGFYFFGDLAHEDESTSAEPFEAMSLVDVASVTAGGDKKPDALHDNAEEALAPQEPAEQVSVASGAPVAAPIEADVPEVTSAEVPAEQERKLSPQEVRDLLKDGE